MMHAGCRPHPLLLFRGPLRSCMVITGGSCLHDLGECRASLCPQSTEDHGDHTARVHLGDRPSAVCVSQASVSHGNDTPQWLVCDAGVLPCPCHPCLRFFFPVLGILREDAPPLPSPPACSQLFQVRGEGGSLSLCPWKAAGILPPTPLPVLLVNALQSWLCRCCQEKYLRQTLSVSYSVF